MSTLAVNTIQNLAGDERFGPVSIVENESVGTGATHDVTGIPSYAKRVHVLFKDLSVSSTNRPIIQLGTSGGVQATGYDNRIARIGATGGVYVDETTGIILTESTTAANAYHGYVTFFLFDSATNLWLCNGMSNHSTAANFMHVIVGDVTLGATLDRVRFTMEGGGNVFDGGTVTVLVD